jgi:hypothetical protein
MDPCRVCGARLYEGATFCALCLAPITPTDEEVGELLREVDAAGGRWQEPHLPAERWRPGERHTAPPPRYVPSRTRKSTLTFGFTGRVALTALILGVVLGAFLYSPSPASGLIFGIVSVWFIKDVWKKARIRIR